MTWQLPSSTSHESLKARLWRSFDQYCTTVDAFLICYEVMHSNTVLVGNVDCHNVSTHKNVSHYLVLHFHLSLNHKGRQGTTDDFKNSFLYFFPVLHCPLGLCKLQACPFPDAVFLPLPLSALSSSPFHCGFSQTWWTGDRTIPLQFASLYDRQEVFVPSNRPLDLGTDFLVGNVVFLWDAQYLAVAPHFHRLYSSLEVYCEGQWITSIQEVECDKEAHQSHFGTERNTPVIPNWFQLCQCCCCLCYPGEYLRLGSLISFTGGL